jgi:transcriptional regulator with XRE-family HTH domain
MGPEQAVSTPIPTLTVRVGRESHTLHPAAGVAVIGRDAAAAVPVDDDRISRRHVRLEPHRGGWQAIDTSTYGMFVDGVRRSSVLLTGPTTLCLGGAEGVPVTLTPDESTRALHVAEADEDQMWEGESDPGVVRAGRAVAQRRHELELTQRGLAKDKIINAGTLIAFEKGRSWPRRTTLDRLENALNWPPGTITRIRHGASAAPARVGDAPGGPIAAPREEATEVLTDTIRAPLMAETVELAMHTLAAAMAELRDPSDPDFTPKATSILADLRKLEKLASSAARNAKGTPSVVLALSSVRRSYNELMMRAARSPAATLGQRLYEARHRAELSLEEAANGAGLPIAVLEDADAERPIPPQAATAIETLIAQLTISR